MKLDILFHYEVDESTGEVKYIGKEEIKVDTKEFAKPKTDNDSDPKLYLEDSKYRLNSKAVELMSIEPGDKLEITYGLQQPQIQRSLAGNKVTKSYTVQYRGAKHDELAKFGNEFTIVNNNGIFQLDSGKKIELPEKDESINTDDIDLSDLLEDTNTVINSDFFKL